MALITSLITSSPPTHLEVSNARRAPGDGVVEEKPRDNSRVKDLSEEPVALGETNSTGVPTVGHHHGDLGYVCVDGKERSEVQDGLRERRRGHTRVSAQGWMDGWESSPSPGGWVAGYRMLPCYRGGAILVVNPPPGI